MSAPATPAERSDRRWRVLVVDDEPPARRGLRLLLEREPDLEVVAECGDGHAAVQAITQLRPDLLLLDVEMPGLDGLGVLQAVGPGAVPVVVFVTAFDRYAIQAFEAQALDYLLKPFSDERCAEVVARARTRLQERSSAELAVRVNALLERWPRTGRHLVIRDGGRTLVMPVADIDWIGAEDYCIRIYTQRDRPLVRKSLQAILDDLDPGEFMRIHRSAVVNLSRVRELRPLPSGDAEVTLVDGTRLRVSRASRADLERRLRP